MKAKRARQKVQARFEDALKRHRRFEQTSSEHAVWMLAIPVWWREFQAHWKRRAGSGSNHRKCCAGGRRD